MRKYFIYFILFLSLILLAYTTYKSEFYWNGNQRKIFYIYYGVSIILIITSITSLFFFKNLQIWFSIIFFTFLISIYSFEAFTYLELFKKKQNNDQISKKDLYFKMKKEDNNVSISIYPRLFINNKNSNIIPLSGKSLSKTIHCNESGYFSIYDSDRYGFNNPDKVWNENSHEYVITGDSYVHGACVNRPKDIASVLRELSSKNVLNLGYSGNGPLLQYATIKEYLPKNTKNLLWFYYEQNDLADLAYELNDDLLPNYLNDDLFLQKLIFKQDIIDEIIDSFLLKNIGEHKFNNNSFSLKILFEFIKLRRVRNILLNLNIFQDSNQLNPQNEFFEILEKISIHSIKNNINFYFVYLPTYDRFDKKMNFNKDIIIKKINDLKIDIIDIHNDVFEKQKNPKELFVNSQINHYKSRGYFLVAKKIYDIVNSN